MHHQAQEGSSRKLVWIEELRVTGWGCSECAWVYHPSEWPSGKTLEETMRNFQAQLYEEFTSHACAEHPRARVATVPS
jgi:hypothetical protein